MAKKIVKRRDWTKEDIRTLKTLVRENTKTTVISRRLKRSVGATYQQDCKLCLRTVKGRRAANPTASVGQCALHEGICAPDAIHWS